MQETKRDSLEEWWAELADEIEEPKKELPKSLSRRLKRTQPNKSIRVHRPIKRIVQQRGR